MLEVLEAFLTSEFNDLFLMENDWLAFVQDKKIQYQLRIDVDMCHQRGYIYLGGTVTKKLHWTNNPQDVNVNSPGIVQFEDVL